MVAEPTWFPPACSLVRSREGPGRPRISLGALAQETTFGKNPVTASHPPCPPLGQVEKKSMMRMQTMVPPLPRSRHQTHFRPQIRGPEEIGNGRINRQEDLADQVGTADRSFLPVNLQLQLEGPPDLGGDLMCTRPNPPRNHQSNPLHNVLSMTYLHLGMAKIRTTRWSRTLSCCKVGCQQPVLWARSMA